MREIEHASPMGAREESLLVLVRTCSSSVRAREESLPARLGEGISFLEMVKLFGLGSTHWIDVPCQMLDILPA